MKSLASTGILLLALGCAEGSPNHDAQGDTVSASGERDQGDGWPGDPEVTSCPPSDSVFTVEVGEGLVVQLPDLAPQESCSLLATAPFQLEVRGSPGLAVRFVGEDASPETPRWIAPRSVEGQVTVVVTNTSNASVDGAVEFRGWPEPVSPLQIERSLVWTQPSIVDDSEAVGLGRIMAAAASDGHGGALFQNWFLRFGTTAHSERLGPTLFLEEISEEQGTDPTQWDLDNIPFVVTAVHNRIDLRSDEHCGEFRISMASVHDIFRPLHLIFLFRMEARDNDRTPGGKAHCLGTARRWALLSALTPEDFATQARALLLHALTPERFLLAETVEFTISPWEWRQWIPTDTGVGVVLDNPPLFQTVDIPGLNQPGPRRGAFLAWVEDNAMGLANRSVLLPEEFRAKSASLNQGIPWVPLDLAGLDEAVSNAYPQLRQSIEIVGCPACHSADAEFVQTTEGREFSDFYQKELDARAVFLDALQRGEDPRAPFGPLQADPVLTP